MNAARELIAVVVIVAITSALVLPNTVLFTDVVYVDQNTGSRKGHREWILGMQTGQWRLETAIESSMRAKHPADFVQDWRLFGATGFSFLGGANRIRSSPSLPIFQANPDAINHYCSGLHDAELLQMYETFSGGDQDAVLGLIAEIVVQTLATDP